MILMVLYFIFYGFILTAAIGLFASWLDRKVTARVQYRVGPPLLQPIYDLVKLFGKETLIPNNCSQNMFLAAPIIGLTATMLSATIIWLNNNTGISFLGDLIVLVYLLTIPSLSVILGGFASRNPLSSLGGSREMKLILSYELPFILSIIVVLIKTGFSFNLGNILNFQTSQGAVSYSLSGFLAFVAALICVQAKLGLVPFDQAEAETELAGGALIEYSGIPLAIYRLTKNMLLCVLPLFLIVLFFGGIRYDGINLIYGVLKYIGIVALITVMRNTNPRVRIDHAIRFFWGPVTIIAGLAVILALLGK